MCGRATTLILLSRKIHREIETTILVVDLRLLRDGKVGKAKGQRDGKGCLYSHGGKLDSNEVRSYEVASRQRVNSSCLSCTTHEILEYIMYRENRDIFFFAERPSKLLNIYQ